MTQREFRFVTPDGKNSTAWKPIPKEGVQFDLHKAKCKFGEKVDMEVRTDGEEAKR